MLGYSKAANTKPLPGILKQVILITMRNPQSYPNIPTYNTVRWYSINVDNSNIEPYTSKGLAWVNNKM